MATSNLVFIENIPTNTQIPHLIDYFSMAHNITITNASMEYDPNPKNNWCYAHVEFNSIADAAKVIRKANSDELVFKGRHLMASTDLNPPSTTPRVPPSNDYIHASGYTDRNVHSTTQYGAPLSTPTDPRQRNQNNRHGSYRGHNKGGYRGGRGRGGYSGRMRDNRRDKPY